MTDRPTTYDKSLSALGKVDPPFDVGESFPITDPEIIGTDGDTSDALFEDDQGTFCRFHHGAAPYGDIFLSLAPTTFADRGLISTTLSPSASFTLALGVLPHADDSRLPDVDGGAFVFLIDLSQHVNATLANLQPLYVPVPATEYTIGYKTWAVGSDDDDATILDPDTFRQVVDCYNAGNLAIQLMVGFDSDLIDVAYFQMFWGDVEVLSAGGVTADFTWAADESGRVVHFDASASMGDIAEYSWIWNDQVQLPRELNQPILGEVVDHQFYSMGPFQVTLTVTSSETANGDQITAQITKEVDLAGSAISGDYDNDRCAFSGAS